MIVSRAIVRDTTDTASLDRTYAPMGMAVVPMFSPALGDFIDKFWLGGHILCWQDLG